MRALGELFARVLLERLGRLVVETARAVLFPSLTPPVGEMSAGLELTIQ